MRRTRGEGEEEQGQEKNESMKEMKVLPGGDVAVLRGLLSSVTWVIVGVHVEEIDNKDERKGEEEAR